MAQLDLVTALESLTTGPGMLALLQSFGHSRLLAMRLKHMEEQLRLSAGARTALDRTLTLTPSLTVGQLLQSPERVRHRPLAARDPAPDEILVATRSWLIAQITATAAPTPRAARLQSHPLDERIDEDGLVAWARLARVAPHLEAPTHALRPFLESRHAHRLHEVWHVHNVRHVMLAPVGGARSVPKEVRAAAIAFLKEAERRAAEAFAAERERAPLLDGPCPEPALEEQWAAMQNARRMLRMEVPSRQPDLDRNPRIALLESSEPVSLLYTEEPTLRWTPCGEGAMRVRWDLRAAGPGPTCDCPGAGRACSGRVAALIALQETLAQPDQAEARARILAALAVPAWERSLRSLDAALEALPNDEDQPADEELGWRLSTGARGLTLTPALLKYKKRGGVTLKKLGFDKLDARPRLFALPADRQVAALLAPNPSQPLPAYDPGTQVAVLRALAQLVGHPRVFIEDADAPTPIEAGLIALRWSRKRTGELEPRVDLCGMDLAPVDAWRTLRANSAGGYYATLVQGGATFVVAPVPPSLLPLLQALAQHVSTLPPEAIPALLARLGRLGRALPVRLPPGLKGERVEASLRPVLRLEARGGGGLLVEARLRPLADGPLCLPGEGAEELYSNAGDTQRWTTRDLPTERAILGALVEELGLDPVTAPGWVWELRDPERALDLLERLQTRADRIELLWTGRARHLSRVAVASDVKLRITSGRDWLRVGGDIQVDGLAVSMAAALEAIREGRRFVPVDEHAWVRLSDPLRASLSTVAAAATRDAEISPFVAPNLAPLEAEGAHVDAPVRWIELHTAMREAAGHAPAPPAGLQAALRDYQIAGYQWLSRMARWSPGACLADDMGLGKTVQALALLVERAATGPALVVCPTSVTFNWAREAARFAPGLRLVEVRGTQRRRQIERLEPGDLAITSYDLMVRDASAWQDAPLATLILDEAQAIKNADTERARAAAKLNAQFRLALTGTPIENRSSELWSLFRVLVPGLLGSADHFRARFANPIERYDDATRRQALARLVRPFLLRRVKTEVARELPPRTEVVEDVELSKDERALYEAARREALQRLAEAGSLPPEQRRFQILAAITRLRQLACHPRLIDEASAVPSSKLARLRELLGELLAEGHRALVFSQFTRHLALVREALGDDGVLMRYLDGSTPEAQRRVEVDAFQRGEGQVFLLSLKAGGIGLNLTAATFVILLDPWWNPAVEDQAADRAHRIGQDQPVTVLRLVSRGTVEEAILALHADKRALVSALLDGSGSAGALSAEELMALLEEAPEPAPAAPTPRKSPRARPAGRGVIIENPG